MNTIHYSKRAFLIFLGVSLGLMLLAVGLIKLLEIETGTTAYYLCYFLGLVSPTLGALSYSLSESKSLNLFKSIIKPLPLSKVWLISFALPISLILSFTIASFFGLPLEGDLLTSLDVLILGIIGWTSIIWLEELGWRGVLLPALQSKFSPLYATLVLNLIWVIWHIPLLYLIGMSMEQILLFSLQTFGIASVLTWAYNNSHSLILATLIHGLYNATSGWIVNAIPSIHPNELIGVQATGPLLLGLILIISTKGQLGLRNSQKEQKIFQIL